jgi:hypothetical protein
VRDLQTLNIETALYNDSLANPQEDAPQRVTTFNQREYQTAYVPLVIRGEDLGVLGVAWPRTLITATITTNRNGLAVVFTLVAILVVMVGYSVARLTGPIAASHSGAIVRRAI